MCHYAQANLHNNWRTFILWNNCIHFFFSWAFCLFYILKVVTIFVWLKQNSVRPIFTHLQCYYLETNLQKVFISILLLLIHIFNNKRRMFGFPQPKVFRNPIYNYYIISVKVWIEYTHTFFRIVRAGCKAALLRKTYLIFLCSFFYNGI